MFRITYALALVLLVSSGCSAGDSQQVGPDEGRQLTLLDPPAPDIGLKPGHSQRLSFAYRTGSGAPLSGVEVVFGIVGDAKGATLSADMIETNRDGIAMVELHAGSAEASFSVQVSAPNAAGTMLYIEVGAVGFGSLTVSSAFAGRGPVGVVVVDYLLYDQMGCADHPPHAPPEATRTLADSEPSALVHFGALRVGHSRSLLALGFDAEGRLRASGCVDLPAALIRKGGSVTLEVILSDLPPRVMGSYDLTTDLQLDGTAQPLTAALAPWHELGDCPLDPAQLLLDCALDALDPDDPLDCQPAQPEQSTTLARKLAKYRGTLAADGCRAELDAEAQPSLDDELATTMVSNDGAGLLQALAGTHQRASALITHLRLHTRLELSAPAGRAHRSPLSASHRVLRIAFVDQDESTVAYEARRAALAVPLTTAIPASLSGWRLDIGRHQLGVRFAMLSRQALSDGVLTPAQLPASPDELVSKLAELVTSPAADPGCPALSERACGRAGKPADCLIDACEQGLSALAGLLLSSFDALDSAGADLSLAGTAQLVDSSGDLRPEALSGGDSKPAIWTEARLLLGSKLAEVAALQATFTGSPTD